MSRLENNTFSLNAILEEVQSLPEVEAPSQPDWNAAEGEPGHILNRPFYTETTPDIVFTADDIANAIERIELPDSDGMALVKVSDKLFTADELNSMSATCCYGETDVMTDNKPLIAEMEGGKVIMFESLQLAVGAAVERDTDLDFGGNLVFSPGFWIYDYPEESGLKILSVTIPGSESVKKIDSKYLHSPDWNASEGDPGHILNRPFYTETTPDLVFTDADIANPIERLYPSGTDGMSYNKVSEKVFTADELKGLSVTYIPESASEAKTDNSPFIDTEHTIMPMGMVFSGADDGTAFGVVLEQETDMGDGCVFSTGLWIVDYGNLSTAKILTVTIPGKETVKTIDPKYLPTALHFGTDEQVVVDWNGNVTGMEPILYSVTKEAAYYWVSDFAPDASRVYSKATVSGLQYAGTAVENELMSLNCNPKDPPDDIVEIPNWGIIVYKAGSELPNFSRPFDKTGIYFRRRGDGYANGFQADKMVFPEVVHPMDEKYMPILTSPNGTKYKLAVSDDGTLAAEIVN